MTPERVIEALETGSSTGVTIRHLESEAKKGLSIIIEPEKDVEYVIKFIGTRYGYDPNRKRRLDEEGNPMERVTKQYCADIGEILKIVEGIKATYKFDGDEIYVRAKIISSQLKDNPFTEGEREKAWVQPVVPHIHNKE